MSAATASLTTITSNSVHNAHLITKRKLCNKYVFIFPFNEIVKPIWPKRKTVHPKLPRDRMASLVAAVVVAVPVVPFGPEQQQLPAMVTAVVPVGRNAPQPASVALASPRALVAVRASVGFASPMWTPAKRQRRRR